MKTRAIKNTTQILIAFTVLLGVATLWCSRHSARAATQGDVQVLLSEAEKAPTLRANLQKLTDDIGGRIPGTSAMDRAVQWGVEKFKAAGADEVHTEDFTIEHGWA